MPDMDEPRTEELAAPSWDAVRKAITDSYCDSGDEGATMEKAADLAATRVQNLWSPFMLAALRAASRPAVREGPDGCEVHPITRAEIERSEAVAIRRALASRPADGEGLRAAAQRARDLIANYMWNEDNSGDEGDLETAYDGLLSALGPPTEVSLDQTFALADKGSREAGEA